MPLMDAHKGFERPLYAVVAMQLKFSLENLDCHAGCLEVHTFCPVVLSNRCATFCQYSDTALAKCVPDLLRVRENCAISSSVNALEIIDMC